MADHPSHPDKGGDDLIVVALSGGVDSAVAAALLQEDGHRVVGMTMRLYDASGTPASVGGRCCGPRDVEDARRVADHLGIPFYVLDFSAEFAEKVVADFVSEYARGRTPNPCVRCNEHIKFTPLLRAARALGARRLATGHYAQIVERAGALRLRRAVDAEKDQSYFLFNMPRAALPEVLFPLGGLRKQEVRAHARRLGLPNADKPESQEICFVPDGDHAGFVAARALVRRGRLIDEDGAVLGEHDGVHRFTVGQRRGLGVAAGTPRYVTAIDAEAGDVRVGPRAALFRDRLAVDALSWAGATPATPLRAAVQLRHRHAPRPATITLRADGGVEVRLDEPEPAITPGQAAVFYGGAAGDEVLGGGFICA
jgi:tRNA-specific 2-thiouridylase